MNTIQGIGMVGAVVGTVLAMVGMSAQDGPTAQTYLSTPMRKPAAASAVITCLVIS
jgi:hypothetical protein